MLGVGCHRINIVGIALRKISKGRPALNKKTGNGDSVPGGCCFSEILLLVCAFGQITERSGKVEQLCWDDKLG